jgi:hypothetical protein
MFLNYLTRLEVAETTKLAVHQNTLQLLRNAQEESSKIALHHQAKALEILRQESSEHHRSIFEQETRLLRKRALDAEDQFRRADLRIQELDARCIELEDELGATVGPGRGGGGNCMSCGLLIQGLETRNKALEDKITRLQSTADPQTLHLDEIVSRIHLLEEKYMRKEAGFVDQLHSIEARARQDMQSLKSRHEEALRAKDLKISHFQRELDSLNRLLNEVKSRIK